MGIGPKSSHDFMLETSPVNGLRQADRCLDDTTSIRIVELYYSAARQIDRLDSECVYWSRFLDSEVIEIH